MCKTSQKVWPLQCDEHVTYTASTDTAMTDTAQSASSARQSWPELEGLDCQVSHVSHIRSQSKSIRSMMKKCNYILLTMRGCSARYELYGSKSFLSKRKMLQVAKASIEKDQKDLTVLIVPANSFVTSDYRPNRVRIYSNDKGLVSRVPKKG